MNEVNQAMSAMQPVMNLLAPLLAFSLPFLVVAAYNFVAGSIVGQKLALGSAAHGFDAAMVVALLLLFSPV